MGRVDNGEELLPGIARVSIQVEPRAAGGYRAVLRIAGRLGGDLPVKQWEWRTGGLQASLVADMVGSLANEATLLLMTSQAVDPIAVEKAVEAVTAVPRNQRVRISSRKPST